jgi:hypothetical protein
VNLNSIMFVVALIVGACSGGFAVYEVEHGSMQAQALTAAKDKLDSVEQARAEEQRRTSAQQEIATDAQGKLFAATADAAIASSAAAGLRDAISEYARKASMAASSGTAGAGSGAGDAIAVLADVLAESDANAGAVAAYADRLSIARDACERSYSALMPPAPNAK